ncbi:MAG: HAMP domain-containing histidine kinase [Melioribacteraceae bacterium]|nr:HAMP domain-containing histidine kinase [Melioribacteraceae bacterium]
MNRFTKIIINYARPNNLTKLDGLEYWRERISLIIVFALTFLGIVALIPGVLLAINEGLLSVAIIDTFVYLIVVLLFFKKKWSYKPKAVLLIILCYLLGVFLILKIGPTSAGYLWMFMAPVFASVFLSKKIANAVVLINLFTMVVIGYLIHLQILPAWKNSGLPNGAWIVITTSFLLLSYGFVFPILQIINGLESTLKKEKSVNKVLLHQKEMLLKSKEDAVRANEIKSEFLAQMSHEIRTPVNTILSFISLLKDNPDTKEIDFQESIKMIENGSSRLIRTIDMILNMSEFQTGSYKANFKKVDLVKDVLVPLQKEFQLVAAKKSLKFQAVNDLLLNTEVLADHYSITQLFANLIDNAIKYTDAGTISLISFKDNNHITVQIKDTGIGITDEFQQKLFEPFAQEESGYTRAFEGNGLGLALVKQYCDINNAEISLESKKGAGSTFTVKLPFEN